MLLQSLLFSQTSLELPKIQEQLEKEFPNFEARL